MFVDEFPVMLLFPLYLLAEGQALLYSLRGSGTFRYRSVRCTSAPHNSVYCQHAVTGLGQI